MPVDKRESRLELTAVDQASAVIRQVEGSVKGLRSSIDTVTNALAAVGVVVGAGAMGKLYLDVLKSDAALVDFSANTGASIESLSKLSTIAKLGGGDFVGLTDQIGRMVKGLKSGNDEGQLASQALKFLGVQAKDANGVFRDTGEIVFDLAKALSKYADDGNKLAIIEDALGKGSQRYAAYLKDVVTYGDVAASTTAEQAKQAKEYELALNRVNVALEDGRRELVSQYSPAMTRLIDQMTQGIKIFGGFWSALYNLGAGTTPFGSLSGNIADISGRIEGLQQNRAKRANRAGFDPSLYDSEMETLRKRRQFLQFMQQQDALAGRTGPENLDARDLAAHPALVPSSGYQSPDLHKGEQELRLFIRAQQQLEEELGKVNELTKAEIVINRVSTGSWKDLTDEHKAALIALAGEYDDRKLQLEQQKQFVEGWQNQARVIQASRSAQKEQIEAYRAERDELQFRATLLDKTPRQLELANAERRIELDMRSRLAQLPRDEEGEILPGAVPAMDAILEQAEQQKKLVRGMIEDRQAAERDWLVGAKTGFAEYADAAGNAAKNTHDFFMHTFQGMEDALVSFVRTGKLDFHSFAESVLADIIRIQIRQSITAPLANYANSAFSSAGAGIASAFGFAEGGVMTSAGPLPLRRYDSGGVADSPQLAMFGEGSGPEAFVPLPDGRRIPVAMSGRGGHTFNIDARGADSAAIGRLAAQLRALGASVEYRAVDAVRRAFNQRGYASPVG
jgi:lambda family phage tail tape measure protein